MYVLPAVWGIAGVKDGTSAAEWVEKSTRAAAVRGGPDEDH
jgi:hypothetical protein